MSSKKGKKPKGKTMTLQNFLLVTETNTPSIPTAEEQNKSSRRPNRAQQPQQKRDGNSDSLNWRVLENTKKPDTQAKYVPNRDKQLPDSNVKYETHMDGFESLQTNQRSEFLCNNSRMPSLGRGRGRAPFSKDTAPLAGPWQTKQNQDNNSSCHSHDREASTIKFKGGEPSSQNTAWRTPNRNNSFRGQKPSEDRYATNTDSSGASNEGSHIDSYSEDNLPDMKPTFKDNEQLDTDMKAFDVNQSMYFKQNIETKDGDWVSESICDGLENVKSSTAVESCPVDKKPKVDMKLENKSRPGSSGVSSSTGATKKEPNQVYVPPNLRSDAKLGDNRDKQFKKPNSSQRNRSRSRDEKHGQRSRSHSSSSIRHQSQDRKMDKNTRQSRGDNVQKSYKEPKFDVYDQFSKWKDSNYKRIDTKCKLFEVNGDLFDASPEYALAHCVAEDFGMGSGIAVQFRQQFKRVDDLLDQRTRQGGVAYLEENKRFIFYMVTKKKSSGKPTYPSFCKSLDTLRQKIEEFSVKKLAIPRIGCGLDRLEWSTVWKMIEFIFAKTDVEIVAYNYVQKEEATQQPQKLKTCKIVHEKYNLISIQSQTGLVFLASEDHEATPEITDIDKKFNIAQDYRIHRGRLGDVVEIIKKGEYIYGLYVKRNVRDSISYKSLATCLKKLQKERDLYYIGIQAFVDENDYDVMEKIQTMCKNFIFNKEVYICWPDHLAQKMPYY